ncbi:FHA domain-containing protein [Synechococcales cyanobacterium C]|uniref:FHA domain-containing protein n=1 Tax=Petrachloros mirabilis ULC683 TaxID=2781853 RepID=A0A8K2A9B4_9CYAN|nr:transglycosylase domain-containing protein [Petrachloros mirabilis]NCJ07865.1 FHA domain-containing protein [Petrachloros mirabilis ULC683]
MTSPAPRPSQTFLGSVTQVVKTIQAKADFSRLALKPDARVAELWVQEAEATQAQVYPLLGERYILGRSSRACDIVIRNPIVSQVHASIERDPSHPQRFLLRDEGSTNGVFRRRRRIKSYALHHKDVLTLGPAELEASVRVQFINPPPWYVRAARYTLYGVSGVMALGLLAVAIEWQKVSVRPLPNEQQGPVVVLSRDQVPLVGGREDTHRELRRLSEFSPHLIDALVASEDRRYYWHLGIDPLGVLRAALTNLVGGGIREGGSTLTQQLARSLFRSYVGTEDSLGRKFREAVVALKLETVYSKDFLLLNYLNKVYLGHNASGFEDAARFYFDKPAQDLTVAEAATLVGILPAPNAFNPVQDYAAAVEFRDRVITRMAEQGRISQAEADRARRSRIEISPKAREQLQNAQAPYYYSYVFQELEELLGADLAQEGNFIVETGLDLAMQSQAEAALQREVASNGIAHRFSQGALVTMNVATGEILAVVGGTDYRQSQFNRATQALRQPGSTFKLFAYAAALAQGISPERTYSCAPLTWEGQTFEGCRSGAGSLNLFDGMALSENVTALRVAQDVGLNRVVQTARRMGISSPLSPVPGLVLGQSEVTLLELSRAYAVVADGGVLNPPLAIRKILDAGDCEDPQSLQSCRVIFERAQTSPRPNPVIEPAIADTLTRMLQQVVRSGTGRAAALGQNEAGKTGTTNDNRDLWYIGYIPSQNLLTGVWLGNDDNSPTSGSSSQAAALWGTYMDRIIR